MSPTRTMTPHRTTTIVDSSLILVTSNVTDHLEEEENSSQSSETDLESQHGKVRQPSCVLKNREITPDFFSIGRTEKAGMSGVWNRVLLRSSAASIRANIFYGLDLQRTFDRSSSLFGREKWTGDRLVQRCRLHAFIHRHRLSGAILQVCSDLRFWLFLQKCLFTLFQVCCQEVHGKMVDRNGAGCPEEREAQMQNPSLYYEQPVHFLGDVPGYPGFR